jgi:hypothetical protein
MPVSDSTCDISLLFWSTPGTRGPLAHPTPPRPAPPDRVGADSTPAGDPDGPPHA